MLRKGAHLERAQQQVRKQHGAAGGVQQEAFHQAAPILTQLLHQLRQEECHLHAMPHSLDSAQHPSVVAGLRVCLEQRHHALDSGVSGTRELEPVVSRRQTVLSIEVW